MSAANKVEVGQIWELMEAARSHNLGIVRYMIANVDGRYASIVVISAEGISILPAQKGTVVHEWLLTTIELQDKLISG